MPEDTVEAQNPIQLENESWISNMKNNPSAYEGDEEKAVANRSRGGGPEKKAEAAPSEAPAT
jgi:hypothetical protein